jgi:hypothetical protein
MKLEVIVATVICFISVIGSVSYFHIKEQENISKSMALAMEKGIDPMAVRCSYAKTEDLVCVAYAASGKKAESAPSMRLDTKK